jgi:hypothetical protein
MIFLSIWVFEDPGCDFLPRDEGQGVKDYQAWCVAALSSVALHFDGGPIVGDNAEKGSIASKLRRHHVLCFCLSVIYHCA